MGILKPAGYFERVGDADCELKLRNDEIERFEERYSPVGGFEIFDRLMGRGPAPEVRHVRDIVALGLVGAGMAEREADRLVSALGPEHNMALRGVAQRLVGVTFYPELRHGRAPRARKKRGGSSASAAADDPADATTPAPASPASAA